MATIEEIERRDAEVRAAEIKALRNLAAHLREAVIDLPAESLLARAFVRRARTFEDAARTRDAARDGEGELQMLIRDLKAAGDARGAAAAYMRLAVDCLWPGPLRDAVEQVADTVDDTWS